MWAETPSVQESRGKRECIGKREEYSSLIREHRCGWNLELVQHSFSVFGLFWLLLWHLSTVMVLVGVSFRTLTYYSKHMMRLKFYQNMTSTILDQICSNQSLSYPTALSSFSRLYTAFFPPISAGWTPWSLLPGLVKAGLGICFHWVPWPPRSSHQEHYWAESSL